MSDRQFPNWEELYRSQPAEQMPWYSPDLDPDVAEALKTAGLRAGRALDIGTGPGTQAIALAKLGFEVVGTDISASAVEKAAARAKESGGRVTFVTDDVLQPKVSGPFDLMLDRGCFHVLAPSLRTQYVRNVKGLLRPGGLLLLKCFSSKQLGDTGPHRFTPAELRAVFQPELEVRSIKETVYYGTLNPLPQALFAEIRREK